MRTTLGSEGTLESRSEEIDITININAIYHLKNLSITLDLKINFYNSFGLLEKSI